MQAEVLDKINSFDNAIMKLSRLSGKEVAPPLEYVGFAIPKGKAMRLSYEEGCLISTAFGKGDFKRCSAKTKGKLEGYGIPLSADYYMEKRDICITGILSRGEYLNSLGKYTMPASERFIALDILDSGKRISSTAIGAFENLYNYGFFIPKDSIRLCYGIEGIIQHYKMVQKMTDYMIVRYHLNDTLLLQDIESLAISTTKIKYINCGISR